MPLRLQSRFVVQRNVELDEEVEVTAQNRAGTEVRKRRGFIVRNSFRDIRVDILWNEMEIGFVYSFEIDY